MTVLDPIQALVLLMLICGFLAEESLPCGQGYTDENGGICYAYIAKEGTREAAQNECAKIGGYMVEPRTEEQNNFVIAIYKKRRPSTLTVLRLGGKENKEKKWTWDSNGELIPLRGKSGFSDWSEGSPDGKQRPDGNCLVFWGDAPPTTTTSAATSTTPSPNNDVMIGVVVGVLGLLLVTSVVMMYLYFGKKRQEEQQKMEMERERDDMEMERVERDMERAEMERQLQLEQQKAMEMESHHSTSMESLAMEVESLRMKDIEQQQHMEKKPETGLVQQFSSLMFGEPTESAQGQSPSRLSVQQSRSRAGQDRHEIRHSRHSPSRLSVKHPGRGQSPSSLMVDPSETTYDPRRF